MLSPADILAQKAYWPVKSSSVLEAPAYAVLQVIGMDSETGSILVDQSIDDDANPAMLMVNGPIPIAAEGYGSASFAPFDRIAYDEPDGTPGAGGNWGTESGSWLLHSGRIGFKSWGGAHQGSAVFARITGVDGAMCVRVMTDWSCVDGDVTKTYTYLRGVDASSTPCT